MFVAENITLKIHESCESIALKNCAGCFDLTNSVKWLKFKFGYEESNFHLIKKTKENIHTVSGIDLYVYANSSTKFDSFEWIVPENESCSQIDNKQDTEKQYSISTSLELLFLFHIKVISRFDLCHDFNLRLFINEENSELTATNINICRSVSINGIQKISLTRVKIKDDKILKIISKYNNLLLEYCIGRFIIPRLQTGIDEHLNLQNTDLVRFYRIGEDIYNFKMTKINFRDKLFISHKIRVAQFENSELSENIGFEFKY